MKIIAISVQYYQTIKFNAVFFLNIFGTSYIQQLSTRLLWKVYVASTLILVYAYVQRILKMGRLWVCQWVGAVTIRLSSDTSIQQVVNIIVAVESRKRSSA